MRRGLLLGVAALLLAGVACSSDKPDSAPARASEPVHHQRAAIPQDRDPRAVTAALVHLDACALIDPAAAHSQLFPATTHPLATGPHTCTLVNTSYDELTISLGEPSPDHFNARALVLAGAKAYQPSSGCELDVPVSFSKAIVLRAEHHDLQRPARCNEILRKFGTVLVRGLRAPAAGRRPLADWDACTAFRKILGSPAQRLAPEEYGGIDRCTIPDGKDIEPSIELKYDRDPIDRLRYRTTTIGGRTVRVFDDDSSADCELAWSQGPSHIADNPEQVVTVQAAGCDRARSLAAGAMRILSGPAPAPSVRPQQPLTFRSDEPDVPAAGACADFRSDYLLACEPYHAVSLPHGSKQVLRAAHADPNVICAIAADAVRKYFGKALRPVLIAKSSDEPADKCAFVEPDHGLAVQVWLEGSLSGGASITAAGHAVTILEPPADEEGSYMICASLDADEDDNLNVQLQFLNPRGSKDAGLNAAPGNPVPLREFAADILTSYFN